MIKSISVENFLSFGQSRVEIPLNSKTNVLIGINGTGKSNFIKLIKLLKETIVGDGLSKAVSHWGGFSELVNLSGSSADTIRIAFEFDRDIIQNVLGREGIRFPSDPIYEMSIHKEGNSGSYWFAERFYDRGNGRLGNNQYLYLDIQRGEGVVSTRENGKISLKRNVFKGKESVLQQLSDPERYWPMFTLVKAIEKIVVYESFNLRDNSPIRGLCPFYDENYLLPDSRNFGQLLSVIESHHTAAFDRITEIFQKTVNSKFKGLRLSVPVSGHTLLSLREENLNRPIPISRISDGTLSFLLLLSIFYNPDRGKLICIDEPENCLHPDMINAVGKGIHFAANDGVQMIVATHSPLLLNSFELEDLLIFEKNEANQTIISRKTEDDFVDWEGEFLAGQMWLQGQLGGMRW